MRKLFFLIAFSLLLFTFFSLSNRGLADEEGICCCKDVCDCSGEVCNVGSPCFQTEGATCPSGYVGCYSTFCTYCDEYSDCPAVDSDGGENLLTKGVCHWMGCNVLTNKCYEIGSHIDECDASGERVHEKQPSTDKDKLNKCVWSWMDCPDWYECPNDDVGACVEVGVSLGEECDGDREDPGTKEKTCISGLKCCDECGECYESCPEESGLPNAFCCDKDDHCPENLPFCNDVYECQETCPRSEYEVRESERCNEAKSAGKIYEIECGTTSGCLYMEDDKFYKVKNSEGKEVTVTLRHNLGGIERDYCDWNNLVVYDDNCENPKSSSERSKPDSLDPFVADSDIIVWINGECSRNECKKCQWDLEVKCEDVCEEVDSRCGGPYEVIELGKDTFKKGCLYSQYSKFFSVDFSERREVLVEVTHYGGEDCENNNDLFVYDRKFSECSRELGHDLNKKTETWSGTSLGNIMIQIRSESDNKNCLWDLKVNVAGMCGNDYCDFGENCRDSCPDDCPCDIDAGEKCCSDRSTFKCADTKRDENNCGDCGIECDLDLICFKGECVKSLGETTINIYEGANIVGVPGLTDVDDFSECDLVYYVSSTNPDCRYDNNGYFVYYNPFGDNKGDCNRNFFSANTMENGLSYHLYANKKCDITFEIPIEVEVTLYPGANMISVPIETTLDDIADACGDKDEIFIYYVSSTNPDCRYDNNGYFVYYNPFGDNKGDCNRNFFSDAVLRPFIGYHLYFNGKNGDGRTSCTFSYENGKFIA